MSRVAHITKKRLQWIKRVSVPVVTQEEQKELEYNEIYDHLLIPVPHSHKFGIPASTLNNYFDKGILTRYNANGTVKRTKRKTPVYFDLYAWRDIDLENAN